MYTADVVDVLWHAKNQIFFCILSYSVQLFQRVRLALTDIIIFQAHMIYRGCCHPVLGTVRVDGALGWRQRANLPRAEAEWAPAGADDVDLGGERLRGTSIVSAWLAIGCDPLLFT